MNIASRQTAEGALLQIEDQDSETKIINGEKTVLRRIHFSLLDMSNHRGQRFTLDVDVGVMPTGSIQHVSEDEVKFSMAYISPDLLPYLKIEAMQDVTYVGVEKIELVVRINLMTTEWELIQKSSRDSEGEFKFSITGIDIDVYYHGEKDDINPEFDQKTLAF